MSNADVLVDLFMHVEDLLKGFKIAVLDDKYHQVVNRVPDGVK